MARSPYVHDRVDDDEMLQDGGRRLVPLMLKDAAGNDTGEVVQVERWQADVIHAARLGLNDALDLHKPGQRFSVDAAARARVEQARAEGIREMCDAWKKPPPSIEARANTDAPVKQSSAPPRTMTMDQAQAIRDAAYEQSDADRHHVNRSRCSDRRG
jgi:hypothetical protein